MKIKTFGCGLTLSILLLVFYLYFPVSKESVYKGKSSNGAMKPNRPFWGVSLTVMGIILINYKDNE